MPYSDYRPEDTYRWSGSIAGGGSGHILELVGSATRDVKVTLVEIGKPTVSVTATMLVQTAVDTGGTSTSPTPVALDPSSPAATATIKAYTGVPTAGTSAGNIYVLPLVSTDVAIEDFGSGVRRGREIVLRGTAASLAISVTAAATIYFVLEWTEGSRES